jgi:hypothetical protein
VWDGLPDTPTENLTKHSLMWAVMGHAVDRGFPPEPVWTAVLLTA